MATQRSTFAKLQRERDKKARAAEKRDRRLEAAANKGKEAEDDDAVLKSTEPLSAAELIKAIEIVHGRFEAKEIDFEEFEEQKAELLARLPVD